MTVFEAVKERRSIRKFLDKPIKEEHLEMILEAGRLSPSARNQQNWKFILVKDEKVKKGLHEAIDQPFVNNAPAFLVVCGLETDSIMRCGEARYTVDGSIALTHMMLVAHELNIGSCWLGSFDQDKAKEVLEVPEDVKIVAITPLGYADEKPGPRPRKDFDEVVSFDKY